MRHMKEVAAAMTAAEHTVFQTGISSGLYVPESRRYRRNRTVKGFSRHSHTDRVRIQDRVFIDPTSGSGSLLINIGHAIAKYMDDPNRIRYYAQELKANTYNLTRMNLVMRGILPDNIVTRNGDTLEEDWPYFDESDPMGTYEPLYVDAVVSIILSAFETSSLRRCA